MTAEDLCPADKTPFWPLQYLSPAAIQTLYPYIKDCLANSFVDGPARDQLELLLVQSRAWLQHYDIWVDL